MKWPALTRLLSLSWGLFCWVQGLGALPAHFVADELTYYAQTQTWQGTGGARLETDAFVIEADELSYAEPDGAIEAQGKVALTLPDYRLVAQHLKASLKTQAISGKTLLLSQPPFFLYAEALSGTLDALRLEQVKLFIDEPRGVRPSVKIRQLVLTPRPKPRIQALKNKLYLGPLPLFYLPKFQSSLEAFPFTLESRVEYTRKLGLGLKTSLLLPLVSTPVLRAKAGPVVDVYSRRGVLIGPKLQYRIEDDDHVGSLEGGYINDHLDERGTDFYGKTIPKKRGFLYWKHQSQPNERFGFFGRITALSDAEIERDTRYALFEEDPLGGSFLEGNYRADAYQWSIFLNKRLNPFQNEVEHLPEVRLDLMPRRWGATPVYGNGFLSATHIVGRRVHDQEDDLPTQKRLEAAYGVETPIALGPLGVLTPRLGSRISHYPQTATVDTRLQRALGELALVWEGAAHAQWDTHSSLWRIEGLRHCVRPSVGYYNHFEMQGFEGQAPVLETTVFNPNVPTLDLLRRKDPDSLKPGNTVRIGLENILQTRDPDYGSRDLIGLRLYHDRHFEHPQQESAPKGHSSYALLSLTPLPIIGLDVFTRWERRHLEEVHTRLKLFSQETWTLSFAAHHLNSRIEQYATCLDYRFNEHYSSQFEFRFDAHTGRFLHHGYRLYARLSQSWSLGLSLDFYPSSSDPRERTRLSFKLRMLPALDG